MDNHSRIRPITVRHWVTCVLCGLTIALTGPTAWATVGPMVRVRLADAHLKSPAVDGQLYAGTWEIDFHRAGELTDFQLEGDGWRIVSVNAVPAATIAGGATAKIDFKAIPADANKPLRISFRVDGRPVTKIYEVGPDLYERAGKPGRAVSFRSPDDIPAGGVTEASVGTGPLVVPDPAGEAPSTQGDTNLRVTGRIVYDRPDNFDANGNGTGGTTNEAVDGIWVQVMDQDDLADDVIWEGYTNIDGTFDTGLVFIDDPGGPDVYVRFETDTPWVVVEADSILEEDYSWSTEDNVVEDFGGGDLHFGWIAPASDDQACFIHNSIRRAHRFVLQHGGVNVPQVDCQWPEQGSNNAFYDGEIHISTVRQWNDATHIHEYGHHLLEEFAFNIAPDYCNGYCDGASGIPNCYMTLPTASCGHCPWCPETDHDAWNEGMPNWLADVVTRDFPMSYQFQNGDPYTALRTRSMESVFTCCQDGVSGDPFRTENFLGALLTDIEDATNDDQDMDDIGDCLSLGPGPIFTLALVDDVTTPAEFIAAFMSRYPEHLNGFYKTAFNVHPSYVNTFPVDLNPPGAVTTYSSPSHPVGIGGQLPCITVEWDQPEDDVTGACAWSVLFTEDPTDVVDLTVEVTDSCYSSETIAPQRVGTYYLGLRAQDCAGRWSNESAMLGPFEVTDCDGSGLVDACDTSCSVVNLGQGCLIAPGWCNVSSCGFAEDCNANIVPDSCDLALGTSDDCNVNLEPDECETMFHWDAGGGLWDVTSNWLESSTPTPGSEVCIDVAGDANVTYAHDDLSIGTLACYESLTVGVGSAPWADLTVNNPSWVHGDLTIQFTLADFIANDTLDIFGKLIFDNAGSLKGAGTTFAHGGLQIQPGAVGNLSGHTLELYGSSVSEGRLDFPGTSMLHLNPGASYEHRGTSDIFNGSSSDDFHNEGTLVKTIEPTDGWMSVFVQNDGEIRIEVGEIFFQYRSNTTGSIIGLPGTTFGLDGGGHEFEPGSVVNVDTLRLTSGISGVNNFNGSVNIATSLIQDRGHATTFTTQANVTSYGQSIYAHAGTLNLDAAIGGPINLDEVSLGVVTQAGTINFNSGEDVNMNTLSLGAGTLRGPGTMTCNGQMEWLRAGQLWGPGIFYANGGVNLLESGGGAKTLYNRVFNNAATFVLTGGFGMQSGSVLNNLVGGVLDFQDDNGRITTQGSHDLNNAGLLVKSGGAGTSEVWPVVHNTGTVEIQSGEFEFYDDYFQTDGQTVLNGGTLHMREFTDLPVQLQGGSLIGNGMVDGDVINTGGTVAPGMSIGHIIVDESYSQESGGALEIELGGYDPVTGFDRLTVSSDATLGGTLIAALTNGFVPVIGDTFDIMTCGILSGEFDDIVRVNFPSDLGVRVLYATDLATIEIIDLTGDLNEDGNFDEADLALIADCMNGPGNPTPPPGCTAGAFSAADKDNDVDVDLHDYADWLLGL